MTVIRTYSQLSSADLHKTVLEAHDIPVELRNVAGFLLDPGTNRAHGVNLAVRDEDIEAALDLIGRETDESKQRVEKYHGEIKAALRFFFLKVLAIAAVLFALTGFNLRLVFPSLLASFSLNCLFSLSRFVIRRLFQARPAVEK